MWISDGWAIGRDNKTGHVIEDPAVFPSGMKNLTKYLLDRGLSVGIYTSVGPLTCLGYSASQPKRPGSCGFEQIDANVYVHEWGMSAIFDDGCGSCPQHDPYVAMRDALNATGRPVWYGIHSGTSPGSPNGTVANMWRTGPDLSSSTFSMWTSRLDTSTTLSQTSLAGPGSFRDPDKLEVGYSPRAVKGSTTVMSVREQRAMFTMWAALPAPLILSADLRRATSGIDAETLAILTNLEVISVNQVRRYPYRFCALRGVTNLLNLRSLFHLGSSSGADAANKQYLGTRAPSLAQASERRHKRGGIFSPRGIHGGATA